MSHTGRRRGTVVALGGEPLPLGLPPLKREGDEYLIPSAGSGQALMGAAGEDLTPSPFPRREGGELRIHG